MPRTGDFRFNAASLAITWADARAIPDSGVILAFMQAEYGPLDYYVIGEEKHKSGEPHYHAYFSFGRKLDLTDPRCFDINGKHPQIEKTPKGKASIMRWCEYCMKDMKFISSGDLMADMLCTSNKFREKKNDHEAWREFRLSLIAECPFPFNLPDNTVVNAPGKHDKKCNWWLHAPSNAGKSTWLYETFDNKNAYFVPKELKGKPYWPWDGYNGQPLLIWDDHIPTLGCITGLSNWIGNVSIEFPGGCRYRNKYLPRNTRLMLLICTYEAPDGWMNNPAFTNRFNVLDITQLL